MKAKKLLFNGVALLCGVTSLFGATSCKKGAPENENTLEMWCWDGGWGTDWFYALADAFQEQDWVKEKYPKLVVVPDSDVARSSVSGKLQAGEGVNTIDIFFSDGCHDYIGRDVRGKDYSPNLTEAVYNSKVPGEDITVKEKLNPSHVEAARWYDSGSAALDENAPFEAYTYYFSNGFNGFLYNADLLSQLGMTVPLTTDEFLDTCGKIRDTDNKIYDSGYAVSYSSGAYYLQYLWPLMWAQYEGMENFKNYYKGLDADGNYSNNIFRQQGRLESLRFLEELIDYNTNYVNKYGNGMPFMSAQTTFMQGEGIFYFVGDWFETEMKEIKKQLKKEGYDYDIKFMKTPVISAIVNKTPSIRAAATAAGVSNDEMLRRVITQIDAGKINAAEVVAADASLGGLQQSDLDIIVEARSIVHTISTGDEVYIPAYAKGKEIAIDFLRFMATDVANEIYVRETGGATLPFQFDVKAKLGEEFYNNLSAIGKSKLDINTYQAYKSQIIPPTGSFPLVRFGGLAALTANASFLSLFGTNSSTATAESVYQDTIDYYTENVFQQVLAKAGINA